jgi:Tol biopolymer transport system component
MRQTIIVLLVVIALVGLSGGSLGSLETTAQDATSPPVPSLHPFAGETAWIAYYSGEGIGLIHPDGTGDHQVAADAVPGEELLADWSPDGTRLVFTTRGGETDPIYEYDLATKRSRQLFACEDPCLGDDEPVYTPDGQRVSFIRALGPFVTSAAEGGAEVPSDCGLWIGELSSGAVTQITSNTDPPCDREYMPRWSPDGTQLTYWRDPYANGEPTGTAVYVMNADGTDAHRLTDPAMFAGFPDWSPDGTWIVFDTYPLLEFQCCQVSNLYRIHPDGSGMEQLTHYPTKDLRATQPRYTPDGQWIVFTSVTAETRRLWGIPGVGSVTPQTRSLWAIPAEGGEPIVLAPGGIYTHGTWQPAPSVT